MTRPPSPTYSKSGLDVAVDAARSATGSPEQVARLRASIQALPQALPQAPAGTVLTPGPRFATVANAAKLGMLSLACGAVLWALPTRKPTPEMPGPPTAPQTLRAPRQDPPPTTLPTTPEHHTALQPVVAKPVQVESPQRSNRLREKRPVRPRRSAKNAVLEEEAPTKPTELQLLASAQREIDHAPKRTLQILDRHAELYPQGIFAQERDRLEIDTLGKLGRTDEAKARAQTFLKHYPNSAHRLRLQEYFE